MKKLLIVLSVILSGQFYSQDIRGAFIQAKRLSGFTYSITVTIYTDATLSIQRPAITVSFGDATTATFTTSQSLIGQKKIYSGTHTYPGSGNYTVSYLDTFRVAGIKNIPNSQSQQIYVETTININNLGINSSPQMSSDPLYLTSVGNTIYISNGFYDADGDSLSYVLTNCSPGSYYIPSNSSLNNGMLTYSADTAGIYAFSILVTEWRQNQSSTYVMNGSSQVDFVVYVSSTSGISETTSSNRDIIVYPNPTEHILNISNKAAFSKGTTLEIFNNLGQVVLSAPYSDQIELSGLQNGLYLLKLSDGNRSFGNIKFIKN